MNKKKLRSIVAGGMLLVGLAGSLPAQTEPVAVKVYKTATCGCCSKWVEHLKRAGFAVMTEDVANIGEIRARHGVPLRLSACHTALIEGYVVEGHVPADVIKKLLAEKPAVVGISVPGMPMGSPGMEGPDPQRYDIVSFDGKGQSKVYASR